MAQVKIPEGGWGGEGGEEEDKEENDIALIQRPKLICTNTK